MTGMLGNGFLVSFQIFALTLLGSLPLGMLVAFARMSRFKPLALLARFYIWRILTTQAVASSPG